MGDEQDSKRKKRGTPLALPTDASGLPDAAPDPAYRGIQFYPSAGAAMAANDSGARRPRPAPLNPHCREHHLRRLDATERAFWRLNDWSHGRPGSLAPMATWSCDCGASWTIENARPGGARQLVSQLHMPKGQRPCDLALQSLAVELAKLADEPDDQYGTEADLDALVKARSAHITGTLSQWIRDMCPALHLESPAP